MNGYTSHRDYKTCNNCGANLDHNERCDCQDKPSTYKTESIKKEIHNEKFDKRIY